MMLHVIRKIPSSSYHSRSSTNEIMKRNNHNMIVSRFELISFLYIGMMMIAITTISSSITMIHCFQPQLNHYSNNHHGINIHTSSKKELKASSLSLVTPTRLPSKTMPSSVKLIRSNQQQHQGRNNNNFSKQSSSSLLSPYSLFIRRNNYSSNSKNLYYIREEPYEIFVVENEIETKISLSSLFTSSDHESSMYKSLFNDMMKMNPTSNVDDDPNSISKPSSPSYDKNIKNNHQHIHDGMNQQLQPPNIAPPLHLFQLSKSKSKLNHNNRNDSYQEYHSSNNIMFDGGDNNDTNDFEIQKHHQRQAQQFDEIVKRQDTNVVEVVNGNDMNNNNIIHNDNHDEATASSLILVDDTTPIVVETDSKLFHNGGANSNNQLILDNNNNNNRDELLVFQWNTNDNGNVVVNNNNDHTLLSVSDNNNNNNKHHFVAVTSINNNDHTSIGVDNNNNVHNKKQRVIISNNNNNQEEYSSSSSSSSSSQLILDNYSLLTQFNHNNDNVVVVVVNNNDDNNEMLSDNINNHHLVLSITSLIGNINNISSSSIDYNINNSMTNLNNEKIDMIFNDQERYDHDNNFWSNMKGKFVNNAMNMNNNMINEKTNNDTFVTNFWLESIMQYDLSSFLTTTDHNNNDSYNDTYTLAKFWLNIQQQDFSLSLLTNHNEGDNNTNNSTTAFWSKYNEWEGLSYLTNDIDNAKEILYDSWQQQMNLNKEIIMNNLDSVSHWQQQQLNGNKEKIVLNNNNPIIDSISHRIENLNHEYKGLGTGGYVTKTGSNSENKKNEQENRQVALGDVANTNIDTAVDTSIISLEIKSGVSKDTIIGSVILAAVTATITGVKPFWISITAVPIISSYITITKGCVGDISRTLGDITYDLCYEFYQKWIDEEAVALNEYDEENNGNTENMKKRNNDMKKMHIVLDNSWNIIQKTWDASTSAIIKGAQTMKDAIEQNEGKIYEGYIAPSQLQQDNNDNNIDININTNNVIDITNEVVIVDDIKPYYASKQNHTITSNDGNDVDDDIMIPYQNTNNDNNNIVNDDVMMNNQVVEQSINYITTKTTSDIIDSIATTTMSSSIVTSDITKDSMSELVVGQSINNITTTATSDIVDSMATTTISSSIVTSDITTDNISELVVADRSDEDISSSTHNVVVSDTIPTVTDVEHPVVDDGKNMNKRRIEDSSMTSVEQNNEQEPSSTVVSDENKMIIQEAEDEGDISRRRLQEKNDYMKRYILQKNEKNDIKRQRAKLPIQSKGVTSSIIESSNNHINEIKKELIMKVLRTPMERLAIWLLVAFMSAINTNTKAPVSLISIHPNNNYNKSSSSSSVPSSTAATILA